MREIGVRELKTTLSQTLRAVARGQQVRVTLRGRPLADTVTPAREERSQRVGIGAGRAGSRALNLYLDASALVKRYVAEPGRDTVLDAMDRAEGWFMCRIGFVETVRS